MGPQVGYYTPQLLMEEDLHGPGIDARGAAFPGVNLYVELGHGRDYAWSATSGRPRTTSTRSPRCSAKTNSTTSTRANAWRWKSWNTPTPGLRTRPTKRPPGLKS